MSAHHVGAAPKQLHLFNSDLRSEPLAVSRPGVDPADDIHIAGLVLLACGLL